jgi:hypothetical protein
MALILNIAEEKGFYQKIILKKSFINIDGLYLATIVFKNKQERDLDKSREPLIESFMFNVQNLFKEMENIPDDDEKKIYFLKNEQNELLYVFNNFNRLAFKYPNQEVLTDMTEKIMSTAEKYGFKKEWYLDPVEVIRTDLIRSDNYKKQNFDLPTFYDSLKRNLYTDENGNLLVADDI